MTASPADATRALELLERALAYTRGTLNEVRDDDLDRPTPCARWDLRDLLLHMDDALDAFTEGAHGRVGVVAEPSAAWHVATLQRKACGLLGAWSNQPPPGPGSGPVALVGDQPLRRPLLARAAAVEIAVHGWDVGAATGRGGALPESLARELLHTAWLLIDDADRSDSSVGGQRFAAALSTGAHASYNDRLLAFAGRRRRDPGAPD